jgi:hypothetical protein
VSRGTIPVNIHRSIPTGMQPNIRHRIITGIIPVPGISLSRPPPISTTIKMCVADWVPVKLGLLIEVLASAKSSRGRFFKKISYANGMSVRLVRIRNFGMQDTRGTPICQGRSPSLNNLTDSARSYRHSGHKERHICNMRCVCWP